jgi:hypothetical protein
MTIELAVLLSFVSVSFAIFFGLMGLRRSQKQDDEKEATTMTTMIVKLENISMGISEIKSEMNNIKCDLNTQRERLVIVEESCKSAHKRIDTAWKGERNG